MTNECVVDIDENKVDNVGARKRHAKPEEYRKCAPGDAGHVYLRRVHNHHAAHDGRGDNPGPGKSHRSVPRFRQEEKSSRGEHQANDISQEELILPEVPRELSPGYREETVDKYDKRHYPDRFGSVG